MIDLELDELFLQSYTMKFGIRADDPKSDDLVEDAMVEYDGEKFFITKVIETREDEVAMHRIEAEASWMRLADQKRPGSFVIELLTPSEGLIQILEGSGWSIAAQVDTSALEYSLEASDASVLDILWQWAKITLNELSFNTTNNTIAMIPQVGVNRGLSFRYGRNLKSIKRTATPPLVTRLYAFGHNELSIAGLTGGYEYIEDYSFYTATGITIDEARANYRKDEIWVDDSFTDETPLYAAAQARLAIRAQPTVLYEASVIDLSAIIGINEYVYAGGDTVYVHDDILGFGGNARISRRVRHPKEPFRDQVELSFSDILIPDPKSATSRPSTREWVQFLQNNVAEQRIRNDQTYYVNRLPLTFREGGKANFHLDATFVGVGAGIVYFEIVDGIGGPLIHSPIALAYTDALQFAVVADFAMEELSGSYDYRIKVYTVASGGPGVGKGVTIDEDELCFYILAQDATRQTPGIPDSIRFDINGTANVATGSTQLWQVPDNVTEITAEVVGASGASYSTPGGGGAQLIVSFPVTPGEILDIDVGRKGQPVSPTSSTQNRSWPNGGAGSSRAVGDPSSPSVGGGGGSSSAIRRNGYSFAQSIVVAAGGGGCGEDGGDGGQGGIYEGGDGTGYDPGFGATQFAGGLAALIDPGNDPPAAVGAFNHGGDGARDTSALSNHSGGGGGGWYGGGGAGRDNGSNDTGGGGGGTSYWAADQGVSVISLSDGFNDPDAEGYVIISWELPEEA